VSVRWLEGGSSNNSGCSPWRGAARRELYERQTGEITSLTRERESERVASGLGQTRCAAADKGLRTQAGWVRASAESVAEMEPRLMPPPPVVRASVPQRILKHPKSYAFNRLK